MKSLLALAVAILILARTSIGALSLSAVGCQLSDLAESREPRAESDEQSTSIQVDCGIVACPADLYSDVCHENAKTRKEDAADAELWTFDRLDRIGGHETTVLGDPRVVSTPIGTAIEFDGVDDALMVDVHPLAGAETFTWEAIFRPDGGGAAQRWFHLQEAGTDNRLLFEIRVVGNQWYLDSYGHSGDAQQALMNRESLHPLGAWYHVAAVYDGREFRNYVNGIQEGAATIRLMPQGPGRSSIGVRITLVDYFKGAIHLARFTRQALPPSEFLRVSSR